MLRPFLLPADLTTMAEILPLAFVYPDHPEWNLQIDDMESILKLVGTARRLWPLFFLISKMSRQLDDFLQGFIWEEDGKPVGLVNVSRIGTSDVWEIGNVSVIPSYRGRGIARNLVLAAVDLARQRNGKRAVLEVIKGNTPAAQLYESMGFEHFASSVQLQHPAPGPRVNKSTIPSGYHCMQQRGQKWSASYQLARRITPPEVQKYRPVTEAEFRAAPTLQVVTSLVAGLSGQREVGLVVENDAREPVVIATSQLSLQTHGRGVTNVRVRLDEYGHPELAPYLTGYVLNMSAWRSPNNRIEWEVPTWETALLEAALAEGFAPLYEHQSMGLELQRGKVGEMV